jgi:hypothetical protein
MQIYSASPTVRVRQAVADVTALALVAVSVGLGILAWSVIGAFADFGRRVEEAGRGLRGSMDDAASTLGGVPLLGDAAAAPFRGASGVAGSLAASGQEQQHLVSTAALVAGVLIALLPTALVLWVWLRRRAAFARRARRAQRLDTTSGGVELLALRALTSARPAVLLAVSPDPVAGWRRGDADVVRALADLELRAAGVLH